MKRNYLLFSVIAILFATIGAYFGVRQFEAEKLETALTAKFFALALPDDRGTQQRLSQWKGRKLVLNFWATWCAPCVQEMPELSGLQAELASNNTQILGIGIDSPSNIREFSSKYKIAYPLLTAGMDGSELSREFGNLAGGLPFTVLLGADGRIRKTYLGRLKMNELRADISAL